MLHLFNIQNLKSYLRNFCDNNFFNVRTSTKWMLHFCFLNAFIKHPLWLLLFSTVRPSNLKMAVTDHLYRLLSQKLKSTAISSPKASYTTQRDDCASAFRGGAIQRRQNKGEIRSTRSHLRRPEEELSTGYRCVPKKTVLSSTQPTAPVPAPTKSWCPLVCPPAASTTVPGRLYK